MARINIDGRIFTGNAMSIVGGRVIIDGVEQDGTLQGVVEVRVLEGIIGELNTDASVNCNDVNGNVNAGGSVNCDSVGGSVNAGGSVNCDEVGGSITAGGSVRHS